MATVTPKDPLRNIADIFIVNRETIVCLRSPSVHKSLGISHFRTTSDRGGNMLTINGKFALKYTVTLLATLILLLGCGQGELQIFLTDAPVDGAKHVYITVKKIEVSTGGEGWVDVTLSASSRIDLLSLQGGTSLSIGELGKLPAARYNQLRLFLDEASPPTIVLSDDSEQTMEIPSSVNTGVKVNLDFNIEAGKQNLVVIDFDLRKSVQSTAQGYQMSPVLRIVKQDETGTISGSTGASVVCLYEKDATKDNSSSCENAIASVAAKDGHFAFGFVPAGTYDLRFFDGAGAQTGTDKEITVTVGATTDAS